VKENKLEGVVQKKNCPYYSDYLWLVKEKDTLHSRKVLVGISCIGDQNGTLSQSINDHWRLLTPQLHHSEYGVA
jgi:hypothetical protein